MERTEAYTLHRWDCPACGHVNDVDLKVFGPVDDEDDEADLNCEACGDLVNVEKPVE